MPKRTDIRRILIIGAGPIVIGQACEFDYSGTQACRALMSEGYEVILVNSNPATIMTDPQLATRTYIEPLTVENILPILEKEKPDAILPTMGGQTALNLTFELHRQGVLQELGIETIGASYQAIEVAEDRHAFKQVVEQVGLSSLVSKTATTLSEAKSILKELGLPIILRPAFTLGGSGGAAIFEEKDFDDAVDLALSQSPISQVLLEESALGWKEYEFEVMRDHQDNVVIVCSVENMDPMGVHTGDSITVAPAQTLSDVEYQQLRNASIDIIRAVGVDAGGCNIQFAIHPKTGRTIVIEMNPRVSRSSALVSKATGVPIAKISAQLAIGKTLDEIQNDITLTTPACFEPAIDYVVTKIPRFSFEKFPGANQTLSPQMKSVGEVMAIGATFQESFQKALRGLEMGLNGFQFIEDPELVKDIKINTALIIEKLRFPNPQRLYWLYQGFKQGLDIESLSDITGIDLWFLENLKDIVETETILSNQKLMEIERHNFWLAKTQGFSDKQLAKILWVNKTEVRKQRKALNITPVYKAVDTCAAEFDAKTPYYYSTYHGIETELPPIPQSNNNQVIIIGAGPNRIGQGLEFDYCCVHAALELKKRGYTAIMVNSNPETVSTDYDISSRLFFEPLTLEDVQNLMEAQNPMGLITQFGGQTALNLAFSFDKHDVQAPIMGTTINNMHIAEDRKAFKKILEQTALLAPPSGMAFTIEEAIEIAEKIGYPIIARPSFVLGGRAMRVFYNTDSLKKYLQESIQVEPEHPVLIERFLEDAIEIDVDAVSDGTDVVIGGIMEHIEHAGIHSGDSSCVWPAQTIHPAMLEEITQATQKLALALQVKGCLNIQFAIKNDFLYVLEVNPRASRTVPFISKATGIPLISLAIDVMLGKPLCELNIPQPLTGHVAVKAPVFPFIKFQGADPLLGPEMKSTGEVMGLDRTFPMAYAKAQIAAGIKLPQLNNPNKKPTIFISVNDYDKQKVPAVAKRYYQLGFNLCATKGTAELLTQQYGLKISTVLKKHEGSGNIEELIQQGEIDLIINTPIGEAAMVDDSYIRKAAILNQVPVITTLTSANALAESLASLKAHTTYALFSVQETLQAKDTTQVI